MYCSWTEIVSVIHRALLYPLCQSQTPLYLASVGGSWKILFHSPGFASRAPESAVEDDAGEVLVW